MTTTVSAAKARISAAEQGFNSKSNIDLSVFTSCICLSLHLQWQRSIPAKVNLNSFALDNSSFSLCAFSTDYESLEDLIDLLKALPGVDPNSVRFTSMASDPTALGSSGCQSLSTSKPVSASLRGKFIRFITTDLEDLYFSVSDYGQYNKIKLYNSLLKKIGGV